MSHGKSAEGGDGGGVGGGSDGGGDVIDAMIALSSSFSAAHDDVESSSHVRHVAIHFERARVHLMPSFFGLGHCASGCSGVGRKRV